jgi:hypothetical protein
VSLGNQIRADRDGKPGLNLDFSQLQVCQENYSQRYPRECKAEMESGLSLDQVKNLVEVLTLGRMSFSISLESLP